MLTGTCHCGEVTWTLDHIPNATTSCNCSLCRRYGTLWVHGFYGHEINTVGKTSIYRRKVEGRDDFHFCSTCKCLTHYVAGTANEDGRHLSAVNLRLADPEAISDITIDHFDGFESCKVVQRNQRKISDIWF